MQGPWTGPRRACGRRGKKLWTLWLCRWAYCRHKYGGHRTCTIGKAIYMASFNRPLLSVLEAVFPKFTWEAEERAPSLKEIEEVTCFMVLSVQASSPLKFVMSEVISCSSATPTGGFCVWSLRLRIRAGHSSLPLPTGVWDAGLHHQMRPVALRARRVPAKGLCDPTVRKALLESTIH